MVLKVNHMVQGQPWAQVGPFYSMVNHRWKTTWLTVWFLTIWFNQMVNRASLTIWLTIYGFQGQPYGSRSTMGPSRPLLLIAFFNRSLRLSVL